MKTVLIITNTIDLTVDYIIDKYSDKCKFFRLNTDRFQDYAIKINSKDTLIEYRDKSSHLFLSECDSMYYRKITLPTLDEYPNKYRQMMQREMMTVIDGIAETAGGIGLTRPSIIRKADNKVIQLGIASAIGFKLPNSLITNEDLVAKSFTSSNKTIVKPISVGKILSSNSVGFIQTNIVKATSEIKGLSNSPAYFQFYQPKDYEVRLTIVNEVFFGVRIDSSNKIDWRKEDAVLKYSKIDIPSDIAGKCLKMMCQLELKFAAFDFIVNNGDYFFLELNANGQWLWLEEELDIDISTEIMNVLVSGL